MITGAMIAALLLASAANGDAPRSYPLVPQPDNFEKMCSAEVGLCLSISRETEEPPQLVVEQKMTAGEPRVTRLPLAPVRGGEFEMSGIWPRIITYRNTEYNPDTYHNGILIGLTSSASAGYSGGGAQVMRLHLWQLNTSYGSPRLMSELLDVPLSGNVMIRACFSEKDMEDRRGACHDEYEHDAELTLAKGLSYGLPVLQYVFRAKAFPSFARRNGDSLDHSKISEREKRWSDDLHCNYRRTLRLNPATDRYEFDRLAPDCSGYTVP